MSISRVYRFLTIPEAAQLSGEDEETIRAKCRVLCCHPTREEYVNERELIEKIGIKE
jgi:hypothetical protein